MSSLPSGMKPGRYINPKVLLRTFAVTKQEPLLQMSSDDQYFFDLQGYVIVRNVLSESEVQEANDIISRRAKMMLSTPDHDDEVEIESSSSKVIERKHPELRNTLRGTAFSAHGNRKDLGGVLEWGKEDSRIFKSVLAHPKLIPYFHTLLGYGYRMDHMPFCILQDTDSEGFQLHGGTIDCSNGNYNPHLAYSYVHGTMQCALLGCNVMLVDHDEGDGGFCIVPGSHKSNFKMPQGMVDGERYLDYIVQPMTKAGDVVLFSEGTVHGAMAWRSQKQRRTCLYRFGPADRAYGRSYLSRYPEGDGGWPSAMYDDMTDAQRAVLEPPYAIRLDRPTIQPDCTSVQISSRSSRKKQHDQEVFGTKYF